MLVGVDVFAKMVKGLIEPHSSAVGRFEGTER